jgi:hypothetical protein
MGPTLPCGPLGVHQPYTPSVFKSVESDSRESSSSRPMSSGG